MKRTVWSLAFFLFVAPLFLAAQTQATQPAVLPPSPQPVINLQHQPVYFYLYARITDHVNLDITEARLRRVLPMIEKFRAAHPEAHVAATILFSGASSEALAERNAKTGIKDFVLGYKKRGIIEIGYDGTDEPTYVHRPLLHQIEALSDQQRWMERASEDEKLLTESRDPLTGNPRPGTVGGLKEMQAVFGEAAYVAGVSAGYEFPDGAEHPTVPGAGVIPTVTPEIGNWEVVPFLKRYSPGAILSGIPASNPAHLPGFNGSVLGVGMAVSPVPETSPDLFWEDGGLRLSESGGRGARIIHGYDGPAAIQDFTTKLDRSEIRIIHMELGSETDYLKPDFAKTLPSPSLIYAYAHPDNPTVPAEDRLSAEEVNAAYTKEEASLNWLLADFMSANPGSRFVSNSDLKGMAGRSSEFSISVDELRAAMKDAVEKWGVNTYPPSHFKVGNHYLSLTEAFQVMTDALAELSRTGKLPQTVTVVQVYGPIGMPTGHGPNTGDVTVASIAKVCAEIKSSLHDDTGYPMPKNTVPSVLTVDGVAVNAAQFLRLMAQALVDPTPDAKLRVRMTYMIAGASQFFPKTRGLGDAGATWTIKPAPLEASGPNQAAR